jgi:hypothetical protein
LKTGYSFQLTGDRLRSSEKYFPKSWKIEEITLNDEIQYSLIEQHNDDSSICLYAEKTFEAELPNKFRGLQLLKLVQIPMVQTIFIVSH